MDTSHLADKKNFRSVFLLTVVLLLGLAPREARAAVTFSGNYSKGITAIAAFLAALLAFSSVASAMSGPIPRPTAYWRGSNGTLWTAGSNWSPDPEGSANPVNLYPIHNIVFSATGSSNSSDTDLGGDMTIPTLTINSTDPVGISGGNLTIDGGVDPLLINTTTAIATHSAAGDVIINAPIIVTGNATTFAIENQNTTLASLTATNNIIKEGNGVLNLSGPSTITGDITVNHGTLAISGNTSSTNTMIKNGTIEVAAGGSINSTSDIFVGILGGDNGTFHVNGGSVSNARGYLGSNAGSFGAAIVSAGNWMNSADLFVGLQGAGSLTINGTGNVTNSDAYIGHISGSNGTVSVSGGTWTNRYLFIGNEGTGSLSINGTGNVSSSVGKVGNFPDGNGMVSVSGGAWTNTGDLTIGNEGIGSLTINGAGHVSNSNGYVGYDSDGNGTVSVSGGTWINTGDLTIGNNGIGSLTINGTGHVSNSNGYVGHYSGSNGTVSVSGGTWTNTGDLSIGNEGTGSLTINGAGHVMVGGTLSRGVNGTIHLESGGTLQIGNGGTTGTLDTELTNNGTLIFDLNGDSSTVNSVISGTGAFIKNGTGTVTLGGTNTYTGATTINGGWLILSGTGSLASGATTVNSGSLGGDGTLGDVTINSGGAIAPGNSLGAIAVGNLTLNGGGTYDWQTASINGTAGTDWDFIASAGMLTLNATSGSPIQISLSGWEDFSLDGVKKTSWQIGNFTSGISGFDKTAFTFTSSSMPGSVGSYFMSLGAGNTTLVLNYKNGGAIWNTASGNWSTASQWEDGALPENGDPIEFSGPGGTSTNNFASANLTTISGFSFLEDAGAYTVNGNALQIGEDGIINASSNLQTLGMDLTAGNELAVHTAVGDIAISGAISGNSSLTKTGNATLQLTGNNNYTAGTLVSAGTLAGTTQSLQGDIVNNALVNFDQSFNGTYAGAMSGSGSLTKNGTGTVMMSSGNVSSLPSVNPSLIYWTPPFTFKGAFAEEVMTGPGIVQLSGNNTYSGGTRINSGVLAASAVSGNNLVTLNPKAFGTGGVAINAGGAMLVPSTPVDGPHLSIGGDLTINNGTIAFYDIGTSPGGQDLRIDVAGNFTNAGDGVVFDFSQVEAIDSGNYTLVSYNGTNFATNGMRSRAGVGTLLQGRFSINASSLVYTVLGAQSSGTDIQNNGGPNTPLVSNYTINQPGVVTIGQSNTVSALTFNSGGSLNIQQDGALTVTSGTLNVENGRSVLAGGTLIMPSGFTKMGAGALVLNNNVIVLSGTNTYSGSTTVASGALVVNGVFSGGTFGGVNGSVIVSPGAMLMGSGTIAGNVFVSGKLAPGNSPGTLSIAGNLNLDSGSTTLIEIESPTNFDRLIVSGQAALGGTLNAATYGGGTITPGDRYDILQAGSIVGAFDSLIAPDGLRMRFLNSGTVGTLLFGPSSYVPMAINPNQVSVAKALDTSIVATDGDRLAVSIALDSLTTEQFPAAFDQIMPGFYESLANIAIEQAFAQTQMLNQRISSVRLGAAGFQAIGGISQPLVHDKNGKSAAEAKDASPIVESATATNWNAWALGTGMFSRSTNLGSLQNYNNDAGGFLVGADYRWSENFVTGLYGGYDYSYAEYNGGGSTKGNSFNFGTYASYAKDGYYADAVIGGGYTGFQTQRSIEFSTIDRTASADPNSGQFTAGLNLGKDFEVGKFTLGPIVGAQYTYAGIGSFTESGAESLDLSLGQQNANSLRSTLGGRIAYTWNVNQKIALIPEVRMFWQHEFLNNERNINASLDGGNGAAFDFETTDPYRDSVFAGAGVTAQFGKNLSGSLFYNINFGSQTYQSNMVSAGLNFSF